MFFNIKKIKRKNKNYAILQLFSLSMFFSFSLLSCTPAVNSTGKGVRVDKKESYSANGVLYNVGFKCSIGIVKCPELEGFNDFLEKDLLDKRLFSRVTPGYSSSPNIDLQSEFDLAKKEGANYLLFVGLSTFAEKRVEEINAGEVGFTLQLYDVKSGREIWKGSFFENEKYATEDFFSTARRGTLRFKGGNALIREGLSRVLAEISESAR